MRRLAAFLVCLTLVAPVRGAEFVELPAPLSATSPQTAPVARPPTFNALPDLAASLPAAAALEAAVAKAPAPTPRAKAEAVLTAVATAKETAPAQAAAFDGVKLSKIGGGAPALVPVPSAPAKPAGFLRRLNAATDSHSRAERWFERAVPLGVVAGAAAPVLWRAASPGTVLYAIPLALTAMLAVFGGVSVFRALRFLILRRDPRDASPKTGGVRRSLLAGVALGLALVATPQVFQQPLVERAAHYVAPATELRAVPGNTLDKIIVEELAQNAEGRDVLNQLRDRGGVVRMPRFYVAVTRDSVAEYNHVLDAVFINAQEITSRGWTIPQFLADAQKQRAFARDFKTVFAHELRHGDQARRSIAGAGQWSQIENFESEYESYITEVRFTHERLKADPDVPLTSNEFGEYLGALDGFDRFIKGVDGSYSKDVHVDSPYFRAYFAKQRADWPRFMVEANMLLAQRNRAHPKIAQLYLKAAREAAAAHGLPDPLPNL